MTKKSSQNIFLIILFLVHSHIKINSQSIINADDINGTWTKQNSPYIIKGDINIPAGKTLTIEPGVKIIFQGNYKLNVQGKLVAQGTKTDSIIFTYDTTTLSGKNLKGWLGIRFDRRPVVFDTIKFKIPDNENVKILIEERIIKGLLDTTTKIRLKLTGEDIVNDTLLPDSLFNKIPLSILNKIEKVNATGAERPYVFGGGVYIYRYSNLIISNCTFTNNNAYAGGAIYCKEASPIISNNLIKNCKSASSGGAMIFIHSGVFIYNNTIIGNESGYNGGAILFYESNPYILNNTFLQNKAENCGGAIFFENDFKKYTKTLQYKPENTNKFMRDTILEKKILNRILLGKNTSTYGRFINNIICKNIAKNGGGGITFAATSPEFINNTLSDNKSFKNGGGILCIHSSPYLINTIIYNNTSEKINEQIFLYGKSEPEISNCVIENGITGIEKDTTCKTFPVIKEILSENPLFNNPVIFDYSLNEQSKCIDAGIIENINHLPLLDIKGKNRINSKKIDIGAVEYQEKEKSKRKSTDDENPFFTDASKEIFINIYPNPSDGHFSIVIHNNKYKKIKINIFNQSGVCVYINEFNTSNWFEQEIDMSNLSSGIYMLVIYSEDKKIYNSEIIIK